MLRILSDLHLFDGASRIRGVHTLDPLLEGVHTLVLNGDTCDTQVGTSVDQVEGLKHHFSSRAPSVAFITGNHDPDISSLHEHWLADDRIWATHGDVFFAEATPWSSLLPEIRRRLREAHAIGTDASLDHVEGRLRLFRQISHGLPIKWDLRRRDWRSRLRRMMVDLGSPRRIQAVLQAWRAAPDLAANLASDYRATAQVVVFGHIHRPSIHHRGGRVIINTGAFTGPLGAWIVDVEGDRIQVRRTEMRRGAWHPGRLVAEIPLAAPRANRLTTAA
jgi:predicted phosphodiesterase